MKALAMAVVSLAILGGPLLAQGGGQRQPEAMQRRAHLEEQVRQQFMEQVARRLELSEAQRQGMAEILGEGAEARRELAESSQALRRDLMRSVRDDATPMTTYERLLERLDAIREAERAIERREAERLGDVLNPRQRALFLMMRMQFNDRIRGMRGPPQHRGGSGSGGPGGGGPGGPGGGPGGAG